MSIAGSLTTKSSLLIFSQNNLPLTHVITPVKGDICFQWEEQLCCCLRIYPTVPVLFLQEHQTYSLNPSGISLKSSASHTLPFERPIILLYGLLLSPLVPVLVNRQKSIFFHGISSDSNYKTRILCNAKYLSRDRVS